MKQYKCKMCDYIYHPENGDPASGVVKGTEYKDLPSNWCCPVCGVPKGAFYKREK